MALGSKLGDGETDQGDKPDGRSFHMLDGGGLEERKKTRVEIDVDVYVARRVPELDVSAAVENKLHTVSRPRFGVADGLELAPRGHNVKINGISNRSRVQLQGNSPCDCVGHLEVVEHSDDGQERGSLVLLQVFSQDEALQAEELSQSGGGEGTRVCRGRVHDGSFYEHPGR